MRAGWEKMEREDDEPLYRDQDYNEYVMDYYGRKFIPVEDNYDDYEDSDYAEIAETKQLKNAIRRMVNETLDTLYGVGGNVAIANAPQPAGGEPTVDEKLDSAHGIRKHIRHSTRDFDKKHGEKREKGMGRVSKQRRSEVLNWLKEPELDCAEIMRKL
jgi:hypothetical protein